VPNLTNYFIDRGQERGLTYDSFTLFGSFLERSRRTQAKLNGSRPAESEALKKIQIVFIPVPRDRIFQALIEGRGDIAAANLTITPSRTALVDFTDPVVTNVNEIIVSGPGAPELRTLDDLAGQTVHVRRSTSYFENLMELNHRLLSAGKQSIHLELLPDEIEN